VENVEDELMCDWRETEQLLHQEGIELQERPGQRAAQDRVDHEVQLGRIPVLDLSKQLQNTDESELGTRTICQLDDELIDNRIDFRLVTRRMRPPTGTFVGDEHEQKPTRTMPERIHSRMIRIVVNRIADGVV
jgi:hypothetical protein